MLPPRLIRSPASQSHLFVRLHIVFAVRARVVVVNFVIVPNAEPWASSVCGLQDLVRPVLRVSTTVVIECAQFETNMLAHRAGCRSAFVDVIAEEDDEIDVLT